jgi:hypothetical protein
MQKLRDYYILCLLLLSVGCLVAQEAIFAYAYNAEGKSVTLDSESTNTFGQKYLTVQSVLNDLIEAKGTRNMPSPKLKMNNGEQKPAWIDLNSATVNIEEKAYDICRSMGRDSLAALAVLMAHELTHYYEKHDWQDHFIHHYGSNLKEQNEAVWNDQLQLELQADQLGGFLANMAGYNTSGVLETLMRKLYEAYNLEVEADTSYPSLNERIQIALEGESQLEKMNQAFEMSTYLTLVGEYELAFQYLDFIMIKSKFQSRELHNNRGVLLALSALSHFSETEMPFVIPLELELNSRLARRGFDKTVRNDYLEKAKEALVSTIALDENYWPAYVNLASVYILEADYFEASYQCQKIIKKADMKLDSEQIAHAYINLAIIEYLEGNIDGAKANFELANSFDNYGLSTYNLSILNKTKNDLSTNSKDIIVTSDSVLLKQYFSRIMRGEVEASSHLQLSENLAFYLTQEGQSNIYVSLNDWGDDGYQLFQATERINVDNTEFEVGIDKSDLEEKLGEPIYSLSSPNGIMSYYKDANLLIEYYDGISQKFIITFKG